MFFFPGYRGEQKGDARALRVYTVGAINFNFFFIVPRVFVKNVKHTSRAKINK